jgi:catalase-peroxidase
VDAEPTQWDNGYFDMLFGYEWECVKSPAAPGSGTPEGRAEEHMVPDAHDPSRSTRR